MDNTITLLHKLMDASVERHKALANNLANVNTPGFRRRDVSFQETLADAVKKRDQDSIRNVRPEIVEDTTTPGRPDGNNVSSQHEIAQLAQNELLYKISARAMSMKLNRIKKAIAGGGGAT